MTSTPCQSAALDRIIAPWTGKIAEFFATIVETILMIAENFRSTLQDLGARCRNTGRWLLALCSGLSLPMMSKLGFLPPSANALHALARKRSPEFERFASLSARLREARQALLPQLMLDQSRDEEPAEADGDDAEERLMDHEKPEAKDIERYESVLKRC